MTISANNKGANSCPLNSPHKSPPPDISTTTKAAERAAEKGLLSRISAAFLLQCRNVSILQHPRSACNLD